MKNIIGVTLVFGAFVTLCALGLWQLNRAEWKGTIIKQLKIEYAKNPMAHPLSLTDLQNTNIQHGHIRGRLDTDKAILIGPKTNNNKIGYDAIIPMGLKAKGSILVNMGWIAGEQRNQITLPDIENPVIITGIARTPDWNNFTPDNSPENNIWTKLDIDQISEAKNLKNTTPVIFYARTSKPAFDDFIMREETWFPRDKHYQYATFWFSMAGILLIFVLIFIRRQGISNL